MKIILYKFPSKAISDKICENLSEDFDVLNINVFSEVFLSDIFNKESCLIMVYVDETKMKAFYEITNLLKFYDDVIVVAISKKFTSSIIRECFLKGAYDCIETDWNIDYSELIKSFEEKKTRNRFVDLIKIERNNSYIERLFLDIIENKGKESNFEARAENFNISKYTSFSTIVLKIDYPYQKTFFQNFDDFSNDHYEILKHYALDLEQFYFIEDFIVCIKNSDELIFFICSMEKNQKKTNALIMSFLTDLNESFYIHTNLEIIAGVSQIKSSISSIYSCYQQSLDAAEYGFYRLNEAFFFYDGNSLSKEGIHENNYITGIDSAIELNDTQQITTSILIVLERLAKFNMSIKNYINIVELILYRIMFLSSKRGYKFSLENENGLNILKCISKIYRIDKMKYALNQFLNSALKYNNDPALKNNETVNQIKKFIYENFSSPITLTSIAEYIHLNPNYLSGIFKAQTGENLYSFITNVRMIEAKRLLSETDMSISDIATACGYSELISFSRAFKRSCGVSPGIYRKKGE